MEIIEKLSLIWFRSIFIKTIYFRTPFSHILYHFVSFWIILNGFEQYFDQNNVNIDENDQNKL